MDEPIDKTQPGQQQLERAARAARVAAALRANLLKRKQQSRARSAGSEELPVETAPDDGKA